MNVICATADGGAVVMLTRDEVDRVISEANQRVAFALELGKTARPTPPVAALPPAADKKTTIKPTRAHRHSRVRAAQGVTPKATRGSGGGRPGVHKRSAGASPASASRLCLVCGKALPDDAHGLRRVHEGACQAKHAAALVIARRKQVQAPAAKPASAAPAAGNPAAEVAEAARRAKRELASGKD